MIAAVAKLAMTRDAAAIGESLKTTNNASHGEETTMKRRRALIAGLAAVPVLITLKSRSAFAAEATCRE